MAVPAPDVGEIPDSVWSALGVRPDGVTRIDASGLRDGTGAASGEVDLIAVEAIGGSTHHLVRKRLRPLRSGRHSAGARARDHWAYWRREQIAYTSGVLPAGPWLARDQLAQRLAVTDLDWTAVDVDPQLRAIWDRRHELVARLGGLPYGIAHGDFSVGNLRSRDDDLVALDWATLGSSPVGFDLGHLALSTLDASLVPIYQSALSDRYDADDVRFGYRATVSLVGASRAHWMASRSIPLPAGYVDFVLAHEP